MMPVIRITDLTYERLQKHAKAFVDSPGDVIDRLLDAYESTPSQNCTVLSSTSTSEHDVSDNEREFEPNVWFVNVGEGSYRNWDDCVRYGFLAAGWDRVYSDPLRKLAIGDTVYAYMKGRGYVGLGTVTTTATTVHSFKPKGHNLNLLELPLEAQEMDHSEGDEEHCEWVVGIEWKKTVPRDEAKTFRGIFANQHIVCRLTNERTLRFLEKEFADND